MIENYQDEQALEPMEPQDATFATIVEIQDEGVRLKFDGNEEPSRKLYLTNAFAVFAEGDRVRVVKDSGTYVVEYPVGPPRKIMTADVATEAGRAETAASAESADIASRADTASRANTAGSLDGAHTGSTLAFFGGTPRSRATDISSLSTSATLAAVIAEWNKLIRAIDYRGYNLIA